VLFNYRYLFRSVRLGLGSKGTWSGWAILQDVERPTTTTMVGPNAPRKFLRF